MTRLGWWMLLAFVLVIGGFVAVVRRGEVLMPSPDALDRPAAPSPTAAAAGGGLIVPVAGIQRAQLTNTWGDARGGGTRSHHAIDIMAARGTPVLAASAGTVEKLFESVDGGHTIYVRRSDPAWIDYYAHLDSYAPDLREGVAVRQGQTIGAVGSTGSASETAPHLHYEIKRMKPGEKWHQGTNVNPFPILHGT